jgi:Ni/Co efflux regulator RcnB
MKSWNNLAAITVGLSLLVSGPAFAKKPDFAEHGGNHSANHDHGKKHDEKRHTNYFDQNRSKQISDYYSTKAKKSGHCPPGLAKKSNGCQPPGQAKKWAKGQPLPADVIYYNLPRNLLYELGNTPAGQKVVRVGEDILLINAVTGLVIDAIEHVFQ